MTDKQKEQLKILEQLGFSTRNLTYEQLVDALIDKYILLSDACEWESEEAFKKEIERIKKPTN